MFRLVTMAAVAVAAALVAFSAAPEIKPFRPPAALALSESLQVTASGKPGDGSLVHDRAAYIAQGRQVFQALVYAQALRPEFADPFFSGLAFE